MVHQTVVLEPTWIHTSHFSKYLSRAVSTEKRVTPPGWFGANVNVSCYCPMFHSLLYLTANHVSVIQTRTKPPCLASLLTTAALQFSIQNLQSLNLSFGGVGEKASGGRNGAWKRLGSSGSFGIYGSVWSDNCLMSIPSPIPNLMYISLKKTWSFFARFFNGEVHQVKNGMATAPLRRGEHLLLVLWGRVQRNQSRIVILYIHPATT